MDSRWENRWETRNCNANWLLPLLWRLWRLWWRWHAGKPARREQETKYARAHEVMWGDQLHCQSRVITAAAVNAIIGMVVQACRVIVVEVNQRNLSRR